VRRIGRFALIVFEIALLTALILATRCANYQDVFVAGNVYFVDADCYARMARAQMVRTRPGLIIRHHAFENFPQGTAPHTTAPLDYLIFGLSLLLSPFTTHAIDLAGGIISPLVALLGGWFLWWWSRQMKFRYRWVMLILYAISPILIQGTELGRPDHQSLLILLVTVAICAEWSFEKLQIGGTRGDVTREPHLARGVRAWALASAVAWAVAIWVSAYEPLVLFLVLAATGLVTNRCAVFARDRRAGWILIAVIIAIAFAVERRVPSFAILQPNGHLKNWASTIGELAHVSPMNPAWFNWCGYLLLITPILIWMSVRMRKDGAHGLHSSPVCVLLIPTYVLTIWQARWGYFFVLIFALALPALLAPIKSGAAVWIAVVLSMFPILRNWDERLWPNEAQLTARLERRIESVQIRDLALSLRSPEVHPFLAPWWLSPSIAYWSGQPGVAGSSHESLNGIEESARFFLSENLQKAREIVEKRHVAWVFAYDSDRVTQNSAAILNEPIPMHPLCRLLDRTPSQAPPFLIFSAQNPACKLYRAGIERPR
jgi:hypothetical protein